MKKLFLACAAICLLNTLAAQPGPEHRLVFDYMPNRWEDALPLGNGMLGCLVWQKGDHIRLALDRADLWDSRPMKGLDRPEFSYQWVAEQVAKGNYAQVQEYFDLPYEQEAGPTKLPGGSIEFYPEVGWDWDTVTSATIDIRTGLCTIEWLEGPTLEIFIHAGRNEGWFRWSKPSKRMLDGIHGWSSSLNPLLRAPAFYTARPTDSLDKGSLGRLGYKSRQWLRKRYDFTTFNQACWGGFRYEGAVIYGYNPANDTEEGVWTLASYPASEKDSVSTEAQLRAALRRGFDQSFAESRQWWADFWSKSSVSIPDSLLERQYYLDLYKFGCAARPDAPMINLQSVWTADNGLLPPWKSDFHHDLNTQLSYWPACASNHTDLAAGYLNHLEKNDAAHRAYTRRFFGTGGLNVPGVETLHGEPLGGWIQYACSPTVSAWLAQHFYWQWRYTMDRSFLKKHAWPFVRDAAVHLEELTRNTGPLRVLPLSSSPEINDNHVTAWFPKTWTNYDLALARFVFEKAAELAGELKQKKEAQKWRKVLSELPAFALEQDGELKIAPTLAHHDSHRHFSQLMAIHPLGLLDWDREPDRVVIKKSLDRLRMAGTGAWTGYSYAWLANLQARAHNGAAARDALRIFAEAFVSRNSFHLNGDQSGKGYSTFTYDPFTLEGNFAFAAGVQEMLLQSHSGTVRVFPAIPTDWKDVSFQQLRAEGAFLVSAEMKDGQALSTSVFSENGGELRIQLPPGEWVLQQGTGQQSGPVWLVSTKKGERIVFVRK